MPCPSKGRLVGTICECPAGSQGGGRARTVDRYVSAERSLGYPPNTSAPTSSDWSFCAFLPPLSRRLAAGGERALSATVRAGAHGHWKYSGRET